MCCRVEEAYLDAYEGEGWRGANREKLRPTAELEQARLQVCAIFHCHIELCGYHTTNEVCVALVIRVLCCDIMLDCCLTGHGTRAATQSFLHCFELTTQYPNANSGHHPTHNVLKESSVQCPPSGVQLLTRASWQTPCSVAS